jgi:uncharacterized membrane protein
VKKLPSKPFIMERNNSFAMKIEKPEKIVGGILLVIGLIFIILPVWMAYSIFAGGTKVPQLIPMPTGETDGFSTVFTTFSNVCLIFFTFIIIVWAGSIITSRGVTLIKEVKLKVTRENLSEEVEVVKKEKSENSLIFRLKFFYSLFNLSQKLGCWSSIHNSVIIR